MAPKAAVKGKTSATAGPPNAPASSRNRGEGAAEVSRLDITKAVAAAFLKALPGAKFEGDVPAQKSLNLFVDTCVQAKPQLELEFFARTVVTLLVPTKFMSKEEVDPIVKAAIEAGTATTRNSLFDGRSVDFPLGDGLKVQVLVPEKMSDVHDPLYRHVKVAVFVPDDVEIVASQIAVNDGPLPLFYGASGSGKTTCGIAMAAQLTIVDGKPGACIQLLCDPALFSFIPDDALNVKDLPLLKCQDPKRQFNIRTFETTYKNEPDKQVERDLVAQHFVITAIEEVIKVGHRGAPADDRFLVVFLDEAGAYPTFVRAMCRCFRTLQKTISEQFSGGKCQVRLVIAGTGIEGADHRIGSQPKFVLPYHVRPRTWPALIKKLPSEAKAVKDLLDNDGSTLVRIVNGMVQNARVAAVFDRELRQVSGLTNRANVSALNPSLALKFVAVVAGEVYRKLNGRRELTHQADFAMVLRAMAQQTSTTQLHNLARYGLLVDRAEPLLDNAVNRKVLERLSDTSEPGVGLYLHRGYLGVRYELEAAQTMMLQLALKIGDHPATPSGFESGVADFTAMAMELSRGDLDMNFGFFNTETKPWPMPRGWNAPLMLAERLRCHAPASLATPDPPGTVDIHRILSTKKLEPQPAETHDSEMQKYIADSILPEIKESRLGLIVTNGASASYADVIAFFHDADLILVQAKLHVGTVLSVRQVFEELHKMGNRDWRTVLTMFYRYNEHLPKHGVPPWITKRVKATSFAECIEPPPPEDLAKSVHWLSTSKYGTANPLTEQLQLSGSVKPLRVTYAIMVYGMMPAEVVNVPQDVLLLYAPAPKKASAPKTAAATKYASPAKTAAAAQYASPAKTAAATKYASPAKTAAAAQYASPAKTASAPKSASQTAGLIGTDSTARRFAAEQLWSYYPILLNPRDLPPRCDPITAPRDE
jgi:hypothetical protein